MGAVLAVALLLVCVSQAFAADQFYLYAGTFSSEGSADGQLSEPGRIAVDRATGDVYVADRGNDRIEVFSPEAEGGSYLTQFGTGLDEPFGIAIDQSSGDVYVSDSGNDRIVKYDSDGAAVPSFTVDAGFTSPALGAGTTEIGDFEADLAVDPTSGDLIVADPGNNLVKRYSSAGVHISNFNGFGSPGGTFTGLLDLDVAPNGDIYVLDSQGPVFIECGGSPDPCPGNNYWVGSPSRVDRFDASGAYVGTVVPLASEGNGLVTVDPNNSQVVVGMINPQELGNVKVYRANGTLITKFSAHRERTTMSGLAIDGGTGKRLYVLTNRIEQHNLGTVFGQTAIEAYDPANAPSVESSIAVSGVTSSSAHVAVTANPNGEPTTAQFEYRRGFDQWTSLPALNVGEGTSPVEVEDDLTGLVPNSGYQVRITLETTKGASTTSAAETFTTGTEAPYADTGGPDPRTETTARLNGWVNPRNSETTYHFEFGTDTSYGTELPGTSSVGPGENPIAVSAEVEGLQAGATYHFRLVAENVAGVTYGEDQPFRTRTASETGPPQRGVELVNNPAKGNQQARPVEHFPANANATRILWTTPGGAPGGTTGNGVPFVAERSAYGWHSRSLLPEHSQLVDGGDSRYEPVASSSGYDRFLYEVSSGILTSPPRTMAWIGADGAQTVLAKLAPGQGFYRASDDFSDVYALTPDRFDPTHPAGVSEIYDIASNPPRLASAMSNGAAPECGVVNDTGPSQWAGTPYEWISTDPQAPARVFFESVGNAPCGNITTESKLYMRDLDAQTTTLLSGPALPGGPQGDKGAFVRATPDGSRALFAALSRLTPADTNDVGDLYIYTVGQGVKCITCVGPGAGVPVSNSYSRAVLASRDLSWIYFTGDNVLIPGSGARPTGSEPGFQQNFLNLYSWHDGKIEFVGRTDNFGTGASEMSPDGKTLFFSSRYQQMTTDDTSAAPNQIYRYSAVDHGIDCVTCPPQGPATAEASGEVTSRSVAGGIGFSAEEGSDYVFSTKEALDPRDVNRAKDIYEWRNGVIKLVTDGVTQNPEGIGDLRLIGIGRDGKNVLFLAGANLTGYEEDHVGQYYVARVGGGFPRPTSPPAPCDEDSCQGPLTNPPPLQSPGSNTYEGAGNEQPRKVAKKKARRRCPKGARQVKKGKGKARCVKSKHRKSQKSKSKKSKSNNKRRGH